MNWSSRYEMLTALNSRQSSAVLEGVSAFWERLFIKAFIREAPRRGRDLVELGALEAQVEGRITSLLLLLLLVVLVLVVVVVGWLEEEELVQVGEVVEGGGGEVDIIILLFKNEVFLVFAMGMA